MGKDLHYSIIPFVRRVVENHQAVVSMTLVNDEEFFVFQIERRFGYRSVTVIVSDSYSFGDYEQIIFHPKLSNGGFILIARPEATDYSDNSTHNEVSTGKIGKLLGALNQDDFWNYVQPTNNRT
ncbi:hypothetical protein [Mucilaginibacter myungsuensis]|uniref:Uncharacterized protein n=1 Tax=Mucilaginibacter myungsuensis TaxID=649104 RepID=A0A929PVD7_9SPHI|nr:hypothetical protein [Mucilaginibacter myungsuensis]MBE9661683.1 hypothetical protein [Mucilaginibacter myungsuensis]MDN3597827.1 hypothetical protein [Mucilaginibacter myungsuensis]